MTSIYKRKEYDVQVCNACAYPSSAGVSLRVGLVLLAASAIYIRATSLVNLYRSEAIKNQDPVAIPWLCVFGGGWFPCGWPLFTITFFWCCLP